MRESSRTQTLDRTPGEYMCVYVCVCLFACAGMYVNVCTYVFVCAHMCANSNRLPFQRPREHRRLCTCTCNKTTWLMATQPGVIIIAGTICACETRVFMPRWCLNFRSLIHCLSLWWHTICWLNRQLAKQQKELTNTMKCIISPSHCLLADQETGQQTLRNV
jgi:hypothetical protein